MDLSKKILIVDDFETMRNILNNMLAQLGFSDITQAHNGKAAWKQIQLIEFDIVLADWNMPEMNGLELLKKIKEHNNFSHIPVVMITAEGEKNKIIEAISAGANGYILKPFNLDKLKFTLQKFL